MFWAGANMFITTDCKFVGTGNIICILHRLDMKHIFIVTLINYTSRDVYAFIC